MRAALGGAEGEGIAALAPKLRPLLREYHFVGGMPEAVATWAESRSFDEVRGVHRDILAGYERDFAKHVPARLIEPTLAAWRSIPQHLSKENKKFIFSAIAESARARDYRSCLTWLSQAGLITEVPRVKAPMKPLGTYGDESGFKVFLLDIGLLGGDGGPRCAHGARGRRGLHGLQGCTR